MRFDARALVLTPAGRAYTAGWDVQVLVTAPALRTESRTAPLSWDVDVTGRTAPGAALTVDGAPVVVAEDGSFSARVGAPPWPRSVRLESVDVVGNRSVELVTIVGLFDYRGLPWLPIVVLLTVGAGVALFLRTPRPLADRAGYTRPEVGALEEIEADEEPKRSVP